MEKCSKKTGFTLIELLVVVAIIGVLVGMIIGVTGVAQRKAYESRVKSDLTKIKNALEEYRIEYGRYPENTDADDSTELVRALWRKPQDEGLKPFLVMKGWNDPLTIYGLQDPSGTDYHYYHDASGSPYYAEHNNSKFGYDLWTVKRDKDGNLNVDLANWQGDF